MEKVAQRTGGEGGEQCEKLRQEGSCIRQSVTPRAQRDNRQRQFRVVLLKSDATIHGNENVKTIGSQQEEFSILDTRPAVELNRFHLMAMKGMLQSPIEILIQENAHQPAAAHA